MRKPSDGLVPLCHSSLTGPRTEIPLCATGGVRGAGGAYGPVAGEWNPSFIVRALPISAGCRTLSTRTDLSDDSSVA